MPTNNYLWRNILPGMAGQARCIAPDFIGMGKSDKPDIAYRIFDHIHYIEEFIEALKLRNITLVMHGMSSMVGFTYAMRHPENVKALAFYEAYIGEDIGDWKKHSLPVQQMSVFLKNLESAKQTILQDPEFVAKIINSACLRRLTPEELKHYTEPFIEPRNRQVIWQYIQDSPFGKAAKDVLALIQDYTNFLAHSQIPKLMMYSLPGFITTMENVMWCRAHLPSLTLTDVGDDLHFIQEYNPQSFTESLRNWYAQLA
jgi:haloalkane dehalogenase